MYSFLVYSLAWTYLLYEYSISSQWLLGHGHHRALTPHFLLTTFAEEVKVRSLLQSCVEVILVVVR